MAGVASAQDYPYLSDYADETWGQMRFAVSHIPCSMRYFHHQITNLFNTPQAGRPIVTYSCFCKFNSLIIIRFRRYTSR